MYVGQSPSLPTQQSQNLPDFSKKVTPLPKDSMTKMEPVDRKVPAYNFKTRDMGSNYKEQYNYKTDFNSKTDLSSSQRHTYSFMDKSKDSNTTFNPQQVENGVLNTTYESTVTLRGANALEDRKATSFPQTESQRYFNKYAKGTEKTEERPLTNYANSKRQEPAISSYSYMKSYYEGLTDPPNIAQSKTEVLPSYGTSSQVQEYQNKISTMTQELTKNSLDKGQMVMEVAELNHKNKEMLREKQELTREKETTQRQLESLYGLKEQNQQLRNLNKTLKEQNEVLKKKEMMLAEQLLELGLLREENQKSKSEFQTLQQSFIQLTKKVQTLTDQPSPQKQQPDPQGIVIDAEILEQIEGIKSRQTQINKLKEQFMTILESKYHEQMKRLAQMNSLLKVQLQNTKFDLSITKQSVKDKQLKLDFMQKQVQALQSKGRARSQSIKDQVQGKLHEKSNEIIALKHSLHSLEIKYKAQRKQLADKDEFITKYLASKAGDDKETIQILIDKYNFYSKQQFQQIAQAQNTK